jgi:hypothetical protein
LEESNLPTFHADNYIKYEGIEVSMARERGVTSGEGRRANEGAFE